MRIASFSSGRLLWAFLALSWAVNVHGRGSKGSDSFEEDIRKMKDTRETALGEYEEEVARKTATHMNEMKKKLDAFNAWMKSGSPSTSSEFAEFQTKFQVSDGYFLEKVSHMKEAFKKRSTDISQRYTDLGLEIKEAIDTRDVKYNGLPLNTWANEAENSKALIDGYLRDLDSEVSASICCAVDNLKDQLSTEDLRTLSNYVLVAIDNDLIQTGAVYYGKSSPLAEQTWLEDFGDSARRLQNANPNKVKKDIVVNDYSGHLMIKFDPVFTCIDCFDPNVANMFKMWITDWMHKVVQTHLKSVFEIILQDQVASTQVQTMCSPCGAWNVEDASKGSIEIFEYVILAKQRRAVNTYLRKLQEIDRQMTVAGKPYLALLLDCWNTNSFIECDLQYIEDMDRLYKRSAKKESDAAEKVLDKELHTLSKMMSTIYEEIGDDTTQQVQVQNIAKESIKAMKALMKEKSEKFEDDVVCDIDGLQESLTEGQFLKMAKILQITTNEALVHAGFFDIVVKDVLINQQCLIENNVCIDARRKLALRATSLNTRLRRFRSTLYSRRCGRSCPRHNIVDDMVRVRGRKLQTKAPKAPKSGFASDERYTSFFEDTVSEEYAKKLVTQQDLLADPTFPSDVATLCRLDENALVE
jgi:hypothetical protein